MRAAYPRQSTSMAMLQSRRTALLSMDCASPWADRTSRPRERLKIRRATARWSLKAAGSDELGRLAKVAARPEGSSLRTVQPNSTPPTIIKSRVMSRVATFRSSQGTQRIRNVNLFTAVDVDPHSIDLKGLRLSALGGQFNGDASLEEFARYSVNGTLRNLDMQGAESAWPEASSI